MMAEPKAGSETSRSIQACQLQNPQEACRRRRVSGSFTRS